MFCTNCGSTIPEGANRCPSCGQEAPQKDEQATNYAQPAYTQYEMPAYEQPVYEQPVYSQPAYRQPQQGAEIADSDGLSPTKCLVFGIIAAALVSFGLPGFILGLIGLKKANAYIERHGRISTKVKIGHILSKVGIIAGAIMGAIITFYFLIVIIAAVAAA